MRVRFYLSLLLLLSLLLGPVTSNTLAQSVSESGDVKIVTNARVEDPYRGHQNLETTPMITLIRGKGYRVKVEGPNKFVWYVVVGKQFTAGDENSWSRQVYFASDQRKESRFSATDFGPSGNAIVTVWISPNKELKKGGSWLAPVPYLRAVNSGRRARGSYILEFKDEENVVKVTVSPLAK